jgi:Mn2+/Fe2+ NRAMP family transporter
MDREGFKATIACGMLMAGTIALSGENAMRLLVVSQVLNGLVAPPLLLLIILVANNKRVLGTGTNGWFANTLGILTTMIMTVAVIALIV